MTKEMKWFAAKSLYRTHLRGEPRPMTEAARAASAMLQRQGGMHLSERLAAVDPSLVEERVVLVSAQDFDEALEKAEAEASAYAATIAVNDHSQTIETRCLSHLEVYSIDDLLGDGTEVFSRVSLVAARSSDEELVERLFPADEVDSSLRACFEPNFHLTAIRSESNDR